MTTREQQESAKAAPLATFRLQKKQGLCYRSRAREILYGGAAGGGKSHLMRIAAITWALAIPGLQVYLFRRIRRDLIKNHLEGPTGFRAMLADFERAGVCSIVGDEVRFSNGSKIYLCHCKNDSSIYQYQGAEIHVLLIDELTHFTEPMYRFLRGRVRMAGVIVPPHLEGLFPRILAGANPGNVGHLWVKRTFIDGREPFAITQEPDHEGGFTRQYIPALLSDNPALLASDPHYRARLAGLGSETLVRAMMNGDWSIIDGAYFSEFDPERHVIKPFAVPPAWPRLLAGDWGSASPFSFGEYAVVQEPMGVASATGARVTLGRGCLLKVAEWYGAEPGGRNKGLKLSTADVARGLLLMRAGRSPMATDANGRRIVPRLSEREAAEIVDAAKRRPLADAVLDPAAFAVDGGPSVAEEISRHSSYIVNWRAADNKRVAAVGQVSGWQQMRDRLNGDDEGRPMLAFFSTCVDTIRTVPALQHDAARPEDVDTASEDHAADETRYACMSRPWVREPQTQAAPKRQDYYSTVDREREILV